MKTYDIWLEISEYDSVTDTEWDPMGIPEKIGPFPSLEAAQRFMCSLPIDRKGSPSLEALQGTELGDLESPREDDLFAALTFAIACSKRTHGSLHALEEDRAGATCANTIFAIVLTVTDLLPVLEVMVDRCRRSGRAWSLQSIEERDEQLRAAFESLGNERDDYGCLPRVWWEPWDAVAYVVETPLDGCPAERALSVQSVAIDPPERLVAPRAATTSVDPVPAIVLPQGARKQPLRMLDGNEDSR